MDTSAICPDIEPFAPLEEQEDALPMLVARAVNTLDMGFHSVGGARL